MGYWQYVEGDEDTLQAQIAAIDPQLVTYSSPGPQSRDNGDSDEGPPQTSSISLRNACPPMPELVTVGQRVPVATERPKQRYLCALLGADCPFMPRLGFDNCAKVKEDAIRHMNCYQCDNCGKRFGKKYGLDRHRATRMGKQCTTRKFSPVSPELAALQQELENASGYTNIKAIMTRFKPYCDRDQTGKDQNRAGDEQPSTRLTNKKDMHFQRNATQGWNALEPPGPFDPVASRSSGESHRNDGMTSGGGGSALEQQGSAQALGGDNRARAHVYIKDLDVGYGDYSDTGSQDYPQVTESPNDSDSLADTDYIYISPIIQSVVGTQADYSSPAVGSSFISSPFTNRGNLDLGQVFNHTPISPEGSMVTYRTAATSQPPNLIPGPYYQQPVPASEMLVDQYGDHGLPVAARTASRTIDPVLLEDIQTPGPELDNSNG